MFPSDSVAWCEFWLLKSLNPLHRGICTFSGTGVCVCVCVCACVCVCVRARTHTYVILGMEQSQQREYGAEKPGYLLTKQ